VRDLYEAWVEFTVKDESDKENYHSGFLKPDGMLKDDAHAFEQFEALPLPPSLSRYECAINCSRLPSESQAREMQRWE
jgi:hypothetical protein